ncbi:MAG: hypothetical protein QGG36_32975 [Pirellulaceae bacterium]|jgi:hypothetical protein|nr:hypothetical protein [Pirellulaceae bacterium]
MNITYICPACEQTVRTHFAASDEALTCGRCEVEMSIPPQAVESENVTRCLACPSTELFVRKDFPQRLGVTIIVAGFVGSTIAWYYYQLYLSLGILFSTALLDALLFLFVGNVLSCYRCHAEYRGLNLQERHKPFDLETHERFRQEAARLAEAGPPTGDQPAS